MPEGLGPCLAHLVLVDREPSLNHAQLLHGQSAGQQFAVYAHCGVAFAVVGVDMRQLMPVSVVVVDPHDNAEETCQFRYVNLLAFDPSLPARPPKLG